MPGWRASRQDGFALVAVLWAAMMLAIIIASLMTSARTETLIARNRLRTAAIEASLDAAMNEALLRMVNPDPLIEPPTDGTEFETQFAGIPVRLSVQDEAGKIDLNNGDGALLMLLLRAVGLPPTDAQALSERIQDWRQRGGALHRLEGAGEDQYRDAGLPYGPRRGPFQTIEELRLVLGMDPALFRRIAPSLSVVSGTPWVDPSYSGADVLMALSNLDEAMARQRLAARVAARPPGIVAGHAFTITAEAEANGVRMVKRAMVRLTGKPDRPYWIYSWDRIAAP